MSSSPASVQMDELRRRSQSLLSASGLAQDVKAEVQTMANASLPLSEKYRHFGAEAMLRENTAVRNRQEVLESLSRLIKALSILEKYGCNLTTPTRPRYWRSVKHNNPVFRTTVDAVKGGRRVLYLYGYTNQQIDGLSFPDEVAEPDVEKVAAVTLEVMTLRIEVDMIIKGTHPHLEFFKDIIPFIIQQNKLVEDAVVVHPGEEKQGDKLQVVAPPAEPTQGPEGQPLKPSPDSPAAGECNLCGGPSSLVCPSCENQSFCDACDGLFHRHPSRANHKRDNIQKTTQETCSVCGISSVYAQCPTCVQRLCRNCDRLFHSHPDRKGHNRTTVAPAKTSSPSLSPWECAHCTTVNEMRAVLCTTCERPRLATAASTVQDSPMSAPTSPNTEWQCKSCTVVNQGSSILCEVCERPRLATRPPVAPGLSSPGSPSDSGIKWMCQFCTYVNTKPTLACEMCNLSCKDSAGASLPHSLLQTRPGANDEPQLGVKPQPKPRVNLEMRRQNGMKEDGLFLIHQIREAEKRGVSPEEVYAAICMCGGSNTNPCDWLTSELPHLLDEICALAASVQLNYKAGDCETEPTVERDGDGDGDGDEPEGSGPDVADEGVKLSRAEAKLAWLAAGGDTDRAVRQLLRDRQLKMKELHCLGFRDVLQCEEALRLSGGEVKGALSLLQRPLLEPFHHRIWAEQPEPPIDPKHPDKQRMCRRLLALYDLPSWGRCELVLALLQEPDVTYSLEDVVQAVKESHDKDFIRRVLNNECPCCLCIFPRSKMQSLTSCQCSVCHDCFRQHFTIAVRDKHIRDMVCPVCSGPDINDPEQLDSYFSTLDIQLRGCLELDVYDLFHKKLMEHALMKDPKFLWCYHCTFGFINDGDQLKVTCPSCRKSFCAQCKKPWEPQHQDLSCEQFQQWKRDNDPEYQRQGLAGYLRDNGITCPHCRFQYALTKGGCMHFSCSQCRYQFCSGCNNPYHKTVCKTAQCTYTGLHAHHPRDCLFYLRDWEPLRLQELLQRSGVEFNTDPSTGTQTDACCVMEQKDEGGLQIDSPCGSQTQPGQAGLCEKHYKEYLVSLINAHSLDPARLYTAQELTRASERYQVDTQRGENEDDNTYQDRLLKVRAARPVSLKSRDFWEKERLHSPDRSSQTVTVSSGKYPGLVWDDDAKTMFRIPWKHAGKQDFRKDEDGAIFKAWAEYKGKPTDGVQNNPASWKTRLRCALNKSPEFMEVNERAQLDISEPYKVYRLVPINEQGVVVPEKKCRGKTAKRPKRRKRRSSSSSSSSESESEDASPLKQIKIEEATSQMCIEEALLQSTNIPVLTEEPTQFVATIQRDAVDEIRLDVRIEESVSAPTADQDSFNVVVHYLGQQVLRRQIQGTDARIMYSPPSPAPPTPDALKVRFPRIPLPEPPSTLAAGPELQALFTLLPFMERGVVLTSTPQGVYGKRFCRGRVFWTGPHTTTPGLHKMERNTDPVLLFSKDAFKQQLEHYCSNGGEPPQYGVTLCFGEELSNTEDPASKLIIVQITFPWAEEQVQNTQSIFDSISFLQSLASQSPLGEITLNLVTVPSPTSEMATCGPF
ncbi:E3 ubiquitin-protein ligase RNF31-like [Pempheris klunzingeri]|uniref:E3 ubiquitin-protein ligase RNF31-like n=1 Tax=Pempheris klunzingeri TaxID=3127111 RepID=UPI00397EFBE3